MLIISAGFTHFGEVKYMRDEEFIKKFGLNLRKIREAKKISQENVAYEAGIPVNQVGRIERGEINTSISTLNALAKALGVSPKDMLDF